MDCPTDFVNRNKDKNSEVMTHWVSHFGRNNQEMCNEAYKRLKYYKEHAKTIYTTKLHVYLPCVGMGIPVKYIGPMNYRTEIVNIVTEDTIKDIQPLLIQNFEHELFGNGPDVHEKLHAILSNLYSKSIEEHKPLEKKKTKVHFMSESKNPNSPMR